MTITSCAYSNYATVNDSADPWASHTVVSPNVLAFTPPISFLPVQSFPGVQLPTGEVIDANVLHLFCDSHSTTEADARFVKQTDAFTKDAADLLYVAIQTVEKVVTEKGD